MLLFRTIAVDKDNKTCMVFGHTLMKKIYEKMQKNDTSVKYFEKKWFEKEKITNGGEILGLTFAESCYFRHNSIYFEADFLTDNGIKTETIVNDRNIEVVPIVEMMAPSEKTRVWDKNKGIVYYDIPEDTDVRIYHIALIQF